MEKQKQEEKTLSPPEAEVIDNYNVDDDNAREGGYDDNANY